MIINDPKILLLAFVGGLLPSLLWLWFWLKEDKKNPEPRKVLGIVFFLGMLGVLVVLPVQKLIETFISDHNIQLTLWATSEEIIKYLAVLAILYKTNYADEPIDWPIYMVTAALGFAALENTLFLIEPISMGDTSISLLTGNLRFLGSTLLHTISSGALGIALGLSSYMKKRKKELYVIVGFIFAIALHNVFNFFIIRNDGNDFMKVFAFLWVATVIVILLFEKVRRMR